jgi:hypothetical protein
MHPSGYQNEHARFQRFISSDCSFILYFGLCQKYLSKGIVHENIYSGIYPTLPHCKDTIPKNLKQIFPEKELCGLSANFHIHVSVSDLYIPMIGLPILLQESLIQYRQVFPTVCMEENKFPCMEGN